MGFGHYFQEKSTEYNFKKSKHELVLSEAIKSTLGECEVSPKSFMWVCLPMLWSFFVFLYLAHWLQCDAADELHRSDVSTQAFLYVIFSILIKLSIEHDKSLKFPCMSTFLYPMTRLVILAWYDNALPVTRYETWLVMSIFQNSSIDFNRNRSRQKNWSNW